MRILVIEDKQSHRESAKETLSAHELTIVKSFDEAMELMSQKIDKDNVQRLLVEAGFPTMPDSKDKERWSAYWKAHDEAGAMSVIPFPFEVVLTDMMMPMSRKTLAPGVFNSGEQVPYGFIIALKATLCGAKFVAMVTETNHHQGAMSAAIDHIGDAYYHGFKPNFVVNGARVMFVHTPFVEDPALGVECYNCVGGTACGYCRTPLDAKGKCPHAKEDAEHSKPCHVCNGKGTHDTTVHERKDWGKVLTDLTA
ncbi:MAG: hypothetical protein IPK84_00120 [Candidatus Moraniibacteriota bacterium]|nr:MAG: hypothetical protein IPK84_00120 [Candidatus Moranbacteria bacterium]